MDIKDISNEKEDNLIDGKYIITEKEGSGLTSVVFKVKHINENSEKYFAAKVMKIWGNKKIKSLKKSPDDFYQNEINVFNELKNKNKENQYIIKLQDYGKGEIKRKNKKTSINKYMILDYAERGCLYDYIYYPNDGLKEEYTKLIFYKILQGVKVLHDIKICNRDIKLDNILLDQKFNPKICDFGFAEIDKNEVSGIVGTEKYLAPEIFKSKYDGFMVDIFNLGIVLLILLTGSRTVSTSIKDKNAKKLYNKKKQEEFWSDTYKKNEKISDQCKKLFFRMASYEPKRRPKIDEVLSDGWFSDIKNYKPEEIDNLENEIKKELEKREEMITIGKSSDMEYKGEHNSNSLFEEERSGGIEVMPETFALN